MTRPNHVRPGKLDRRQLVAGAAGLGLAAPFLGRGMSAFAAPARQEGTPTPGGILKVGLQADPTALDPQKQSLTAIWHVIEHIYNGLTRVKPDLSVEPALAEGWEISEDGTSYMFVLREGVTFHDGTPLKASDVKFTFERLVDPATASTSASELASMKSIEVNDDRTVVMTLHAPDASLLATLAGGTCVIYSEEFVKANNNDVSQVAMGTGPFKFVEYVPNTRIVLERNENYWEEGLPYLDGIEMTIASDDTARTAAVVTGTVDFIEYAPLRDIPSLEADPSLKLAGDSNTNIRFIGFNLSKEPFDNPQVRQAIAAVVDREAMLGPTVFGYGTPTEVLFPPDFWAALQQEVRPPDVERAKELMAEAGHRRRVQHDHHLLVAVLVPVERGRRPPGAAAADRHRGGAEPGRERDHGRAGLRPSHEGLRYCRNRRERLRRSQHARSCPTSRRERAITSSATPTRRSTS